MQIYIHRQGQQFGPYSDEQVKEYLASGQLLPEDLAWQPGAANWMPLRDLVTAQVQSKPPTAPSWIPARRTTGNHPAEPSSKAAPQPTGTPQPKSTATAKPAAPVWPKGVPKLYPNLTSSELYQFLGEEEFQRILALRHVCITPLYDKNSSAAERDLGIGLAHLLIRDLRLHREISVLGPEDSPLIPFWNLDQEKRKKRTVLVGGILRFQRHRFGGLFRVVEGESVLSLEVKDDDFARFILEACRGILSMLGLEADATLLKYWTTGRPRNPEDLIAVGSLKSRPTDVIDRKGGPVFAKAMTIFRANPNFVLPLHAIRDGGEIPLEDYLQAFARDPYDVQLQFQLHNKLWGGKKGNLAAFQFIRRAIELSPGHGKAHMVANNTASESANLYYHSELGYRLLPDNSFAVSNHILFLLRKKRVPADLSIAYEGVRLDPYALHVYWRGIELLKLAGHFSEALGLALQLRKVATPPLAERTIYCIHQNPIQAAQWNAGKYDPLEAINKEIAALEAKIDLRGDDVISLGV